MRKQPSSFILLGIGMLSLLGQLARFSSPLGKISWYEPLMLVFMGLQFVKGPISFKSLTWRTPLIWLLAFFVWTFGVTAFFALQTNEPRYFVQASAYLLRIILYLLFAGSLSRWLYQKSEHAHLLSKGVALWLCLQAIIGIGQYLLYPDTRILFWLGWDDHLSRAFGTLLDPAFFGVLMAAGAVMTLPALIKEKERSLAFVQFCLCFLAMVVSYSRSSYVAYIVGVAGYSFLTRERRWLLFVPLLVGALVFVPTDGGGEGQKLARTSTIAMRQEVAAIHTKDTTVSEWIFGKGWSYEEREQLHRRALGEGTLDAPTHSSGVDTTVLFITLSSGIIGMSFVALFFLSAWRAGWWSPLQLSILAAIWAHGMFSLSPLYAWILLLSACVLQPRQTD